MCFQCLINTVNDSIRIVEPIHTPYALDIPAQSIEDRWLDDLAVTRCWSGIVVLAIAQDAQQILVGILGRK